MIIWPYVLALSAGGISTDWEILSCTWYTVIKILRIPAHIPVAICSSGFCICWWIYFPIRACVGCRCTDRFVVRGCSSRWCWRKLKWAIGHFHGRPQATYARVLKTMHVFVISSKAKVFSVLRSDMLIYVPVTSERPQINEEPDGNEYKQFQDRRTKVPFVLLTSILQ